MNFVLDLLRYARTFYAYAGWWMYLILAMIAVGGLLEGIGLALLMPLLSLGTNTLSDDVFSRATRAVFDAFHATPTLGLLLVVLVAVFVLKSVLIFSHRLLAAWVRTSIRRKLQVRLAEAFGDMNFSSYAASTSGDLNNLVIREVPRFLQGFMEFTRMPVSLAYIVAYTVIAGALHPDLTAVFFGAGILAVLLLRTLVSSTRRHSIAVTESAGGLQALLIEYLHNLTYLKSTATTQLIIKHLRDRIDRFAGLELRVSILTSLLGVAREPIAIALLALLVFQQVAIAGNTLNEVLVIGLLLYRLVAQVLHLQGEWQRFNSCIGGVIAVPEKLQVLQDEAEPNGTRIVENLRGGIKFHSVSTSHGGAPVLSDINVEIWPNESIGIVGRSGAGKTTFFYLLTGLMEPTAGRITLNGVDFSEIDKKSLRRRIGYVTQDPVIFDDTIGNNIAFWRCDPEDVECHARVRRAIKLASCDDFAERLDTRLGERGIRLSGGQRQRIAIARELFKEPPLLIFDEATSALDSHSEQAIQESINDMKGQRTLVLIAHRLSTVRACDRIYVFANGRIAETGSFDELYRREGSLFRDMCDTQNLTL